MRLSTFCGLCRDQEQDWSVKRLHYYLAYYLKKKPSVFFHQIHYSFHSCFFFIYYKQQSRKLTFNFNVWEDNQTLDGNPFTPLEKEQPRHEIH
jgi:hypothetical protein